MDPIANKQPDYTFENGKNQYYTNELAKNDISFYNNYFLDTSAISIVDLGTHYDNYEIDAVKFSSYPVSTAEADTAVVAIAWKQGRKVNEFTWSINSLDLVLGVIGGLSGIVWAVLAMIFGGYEAFKY